MNVARLLSERANRSPDAAAFLGGRGSSQDPMCFADVDVAAARAATLLHRSGLEAGDPVLIFVPMSADLYVALAATFRLGLVAMFIDPSAGLERLGTCCRIRPPKAFVATARAHLLRIVSPALRQIPVSFSVGSCVPGAVPWRRAEGLPPHDGFAECDADTPALLTFTSGSTGTPKAAVRSHGFLAAQHRALTRSLGLRAGEIDLTTQPIFTLANLASGVTSLLPDADLRRPDSIDAGRVIAQIQRHRPDRISASPAFVERLVVRAEAEQIRLDGPGRIMIGGAPVYPSLLARVQAVAPHFEVVAVYGSTEAEPIAHISWRDVEPADLDAMRRGGGLLTGPPIDDLCLRIVRDRWGEPIPPLSAAIFAERTLPPGEIGEIVVHGDHVLGGYLDGRGDLENKFRVNGARWHRTGDAGRLDEQGRLWLLGRCSARIADDRGTLYPFAVECAAHDDPAVRRAAAVRFEDERLLVIEARAGTEVDADALLATLAWAMLDGIVRVAKMPVDRRHNAKIDYPALKRLLQRRGHGAVHRRG